MVFFKRKKADEKGSLKDFPDFPSTFAPEIKFPEFTGASGESNPYQEAKPPINQLKTEEKPESYESLLSRPLKSSTSFNPPPLTQNPINFPQREDQPMGYKQAMFDMTLGNQKPINPVHNQQPHTQSIFHEDKPLFVKINDYEEAIYTLDKIKSKLKEADGILEELNKIRSEEERQLDEWKRDLTVIKEKILIIDKQLFETN